MELMWIPSLSLKTSQAVDSEERKVLLADSRGREEKASGYGMVARMLEAREEGEVKWRLWQAVGMYE